MRFLIGLDDTDNPKTSSTGLLAQRMSLLLQDTGLGTLESITRHQLLLSPQVACTTRNSAICVTFEAEPAKRSELEMTCRSFILHEHSAGADAGIALAAWGQITAEVFTWARLAKTRVLTRQEALDIARNSKIAITGLTGKGNGVIGALAAIGLRYRGDDGRFIWIHNINQMSGIYSYAKLMEISSINRIETVRGRTPRPEDKIQLNQWVRPILRQGLCVLLVEEERGNPNFDWHLLDMDQVRKLSD